MPFYVTNYFHSNKMAGGYINISPRLLKTLPIPTKKNKTLISKVNKILNLKQNDINANTEKIETEINQLVYKLYKLSNKEIKHIENDSAMK